jgi:hypothetical protein
MQPIAIVSVSQLLTFSPPWWRGIINLENALGRFVANYLQLLTYA